MSEPIDFYGVAWPRPDTSRDELAKLRAELARLADEWEGVADTDLRLSLNLDFTECQRERLQAASEAIRRPAGELRRAMNGEAHG